MKVSVLMPTFNHELFIAQAIESFLNQKCDFDIELIIGNDASTDHTFEVVQQYFSKYPEKIKLIDHKQNVGLLRNYKSVLELAKGEYIAILESDDYWTDEYKLQKQIEFLDLHPDYGLSFTRWERLRDNVLSLRDDDTEILTKNAGKLYERFLLRNIIFSPTVCFRRSLYEKYCDIDDYIQLQFKVFDYPVWLSIIRHSRIHYLNSPTAVYRVLNSSISNNIDLNHRLEFERNIANVRRYIISLYGSGTLKLHQLATREAIVKARCAFRQGKFFLALYILMAGILNPQNFKKII